MARYYVAGIPFDSRDALQHYGVKNMEWGKHKFGIDADDRYINYLNPSGSVKIFKQGNNAKIGYTDTGSRNGNKPTSVRVQVRPAAKVPIQKPKSGLQKAISDVGKTVSGAYNDASKWAGQAANDVRKALGTGVDFVTGKTAQNNAASARNAANIYANSAELKKDKLVRDLNATRNANAAAVQDAQSKFDQAKQNAANVNDYERMRVGGMADVYNSVPDARAAIAPEYTSRQNEARVNSVEANRQAAQARRDLDSARGQSGINQQQAENQARINMVNANRQAAQTQKAYEDAQRAYDTHPMTVAKDAINQAGNWIGDRANDVAKSGVGQWVSNAANDIGNAVSGAATQAGNWIGDRANDVAKSGVGQWVSNAANDVGNFVTGNQAKQNLENAKDSFFIGRNGRVANAQAEYDKTLPGMIENAGNWIGDRANDVAKSGAGQWVSNAANDVGQGANGFIDSAGRWISGAVNDAGNAVSGAARDVGNTVSSTASNIGSGAKGFINSAGQWISGATNDVGNAVSSTASNIGSGAKGFINSAGQWISNAANDVGNAASNAWNDVSNAAQDAGNWVGDRAKDVGNAASDAWNGVSNAARNVGNAVGNAANQAGNWIGDRANDVGNAVGNVTTNAWNGISGAASKAGNWIGDRAQDVGNFVSEMANPHYQLDAERLTENYRNYLNEHPENPQSPRHEEWLKEQVKNDPQLRSYYEQNIKNQTIPEQRITEQTIPEQRITEYGPRSTPKDPRLNDAQQKEVDYWDGVIQKRIDDFGNYYNGIVSDPRWQNYTRQDVMDDLLRQQDYWRNRAYRENLQHSELDNRPEGVSDAFWKNYLAHGGTREQYDKDWAHL